MSYADKIKDLRDKMMVTQHELAILLGVSFVTVNRWENKRFQPAIKIRRKLRELFQEYQIGG